MHDIDEFEQVLKLFPWVDRFLTKDCATLWNIINLQDGTETWARLGHHLRNTEDIRMTRSPSDTEHHLLVRDGIQADEADM